MCRAAHRTVMRRAEVFGTCVLGAAETCATKATTSTAIGVVCVGIHTLVVAAREAACTCTLTSATNLSDRALVITPSAVIDIFADVSTGCTT